jgi:hypothetical protein
MSSSGNRPALKSGVDLQLQSAFNDGNWSAVIRLAEKRFRTFNDQYYEVSGDGHTRPYSRNWGHASVFWTSG